MYNINKPEFRNGLVSGKVKIKICGIILYLVVMRPKQEHLNKHDTQVT